MKILIVVDKPRSAIDRLAQGIKSFNPHHNIEVIPVHPKRPNPQQLNAYETHAKDADVIHYEYWKSAEMLRAIYPQFDDKVSVLSHHNPYDVEKTRKEDYTITVVNNLTMQKTRNYDCELVHNAVNLKFFTMTKTYDALNKSVLMVANRIEGKKGILPVAQACKDLGYKFILVGNISDRNYHDQVMEVGAEFHHNISDMDLRKLYRTSGIHICNSVDNFESGTLPILESMACGLPVMTRLIGHVPELNNGKNLHIYNREHDDVESLKISLKEIVEDPKYREELRENGWQTVKNWGLARNALKYEKIYYKAVSDRPLVSVVIPTYNRADTLTKTIASVINQDYPNLELIIVDDNSDKFPDSFKIVKEFQNHTNIAIKHFYQSNSGYGLANCRNKGVVEAVGEYVAFLDDRLSIEPDAISKLVEKARDQNDTTMVWGVKDGNPKSFVENFSIVRRLPFIKAGMFCEQMVMYGGMTQEIRTRLAGQGWKFERADDAHAKQVVKSGSKWEKRASIIEAKMLLYKMYGETN